MENRWQIAISAGLLAAVWCGLADVFHFVTWIGFLGCSTFFAQPKTGVEGLLMTWLTNLSGVFWGWLIITGSSQFETPLIGYLLTGIVTMAMCLQASYQKLSFIPGAFIGCCITFAMSANVAQILPPLVLGGLMGFAMSNLTSLLIRLTPKSKTTLNKSVISNNIANVD
ncbi:DUF1097 domain-containing protein [Shewanella acanthi]|uniref:DUF1097 domain-containing protein n=1 Tax=Shewanella acanthi TaxID=2864212 RepID=UPI001C656317|nr:DUF1097 domain-containing protein [Shewanella acanthi]QYJ80028.1 DUF1097 domain-containing protein [Shewanella acanthi]